MFVPHRKHNYGPPQPVIGVTYADDVRTLQEVQVSMACYVNSFTILCVNDVRTSQEAQASTACYVNSFTILCVDDVRTPQETQLWASATCYRCNLCK
jgi:hypothetical protein